MTGLEQYPLRFKTEQAGVLWMAYLLPVQALTIAQLIKHMTIATNADAQINWPATIINPIHTPLGGG